MNEVVQDQNLERSFEIAGRDCDGPKDDAPVLLEGVSLPSLAEINARNARMRQPATVDGFHPTDLKDGAEF